MGIKEGELSLAKNRNTTVEKTDFSSCQKKMEKKAGTDGEERLRYRASRTKKKGGNITKVSAAFFLTSFGSPKADRNWRKKN